MAVKIAPSPRQQFVDANGVPYSGAKLFTYAAGSTTKQTTYTDSTGITPNSNPIVLDSAGRTPYGRWYTAGLSYKEVLAPSTDTDPPTSPIFTEDNITGVNDTSVSTSQWTASGLTPTYISATQFSVVGDQTTELHVGRRLKLTVSAGTVYGKISVSAYTTVTTITVVLDSGSLDSGLSAVEWSILSATNNSLPKGIFADLTGAAFTGLVNFTTTAFTGLANFATATFSGLVNFAAGADIASAATIDLTAATGNSPRITGTTTTSAVTMNTGQTVRVVADGAWPLTYHATTNKLNTNGGDYTCEAGDIITYHKDLSGVVHGVIERFKGRPAYTTNHTIIGRNTPGNGASEEVNIDQLLDWAGTSAQGDILYRNASTWDLLPAAAVAGQFLKSGGASSNPSYGGPKVVTFSRDEATASGTQAITGVGFLPTFILFFVCQNQTADASIGYYTAAASGSIRNSHNLTAGTWSISSIYPIYAEESALANYTGEVSAVGADGMTITWTKTGSPNGTLTVHAICF